MPTMRLGAPATVPLNLTMVGTIVAVCDMASEEAIANAAIAKNNPYQDLPSFIPASSGSERVVAPGTL
jgi:hypothetical protein